MNVLGSVELEEQKPIALNQEWFNCICKILLESWWNEIWSLNGSRNPCLFNLTTFGVTLRNKGQSCCGGKRVHELSLHMKFSQSAHLDSIIILLIAGIEVMSQLIESVYSYCLLPARTLRRQSHTHIRVHTCTLALTVSHAFAARRILAQTWWYLWRW